MTQVAAARKRQREVFVSLSHPPGEAQYDFGEATVMIAGEKMKAALSVMTLPVRAENPIRAAHATSRYS